VQHRAGPFETPIIAGLSPDARKALEEQTPCPPRLGNPAQFASLVLSIAGNPMLNGTVIRLDGGHRLPYLAP